MDFAFANSLDGSSFGLSSTDNKVTIDHLFGIAVAGCPNPRRHKWMLFACDWRPPFFICMCVKWSRIEMWKKREKKKNMKIAFLHNKPQQQINFRLAAAARHDQVEVKLEYLFTVKSGWLPSFEYESLLSETEDNVSPVTVSL